MENLKETTDCTKIYNIEFAIGSRIHSPVMTKTCTALKTPERTINYTSILVGIVDEKRYQKRGSNSKWSRLVAYIAEEIYLRCYLPPPPRHLDIIYVLIIRLRS